MSMVLWLKGSPGTYQTAAANKGVSKELIDEILTYLTEQ